MRQIKLKVILAALILALLVPGFDASAENRFSERWVKTIDDDGYTELHVTKEGHILLAVNTDDSNVFNTYDGLTGNQLASLELNGPTSVLSDDKSNLFIYHFDINTYQFYLYDDMGHLLWKQQYPGDNYGQYLGFGVSITNNLLNISQAYGDVRSYSLSDGTLVSVSPYVEDPRYAPYPSVELDGNTITYRYYDSDGELQDRSSTADIPDFVEVVDTTYTNTNGQITLYIKTEEIGYGNKGVIRKNFDANGQVNNTTSLKYLESFRPYSLRDFIYLDQVHLSHELIFTNGYLKFYDTDGSLVNSTNLQTKEIDIITGINKEYLFVIAGKHAFLFKNDGELMWKTDISGIFDDEGYARFVQPTNHIDPTKVYIEYGQKLIQFDKKDGSLLWTYDAGVNFGDPNIHEPSNTVFYTTRESGQEKLHAINTDATLGGITSDKVWTVTFNKQINPDYMKDNTFIYIEDSTGTKLENNLLLGPEGKQVLIQPPSGNYQPGTYKVVVLDTVQSIIGKKLTKSYSKEFVVKE